MARWRKLVPGPPISILRPVIFGVAAHRRVRLALDRRRGEAVGEANGAGGASDGRNDTEIREHLANERTLLSWVRTGAG